VSLLKPENRFAIELPGIPMVQEPNYRIGAKVTGIHEGELGG
jgi:hypothetical protein